MSPQRHILFVTDFFMRVTFKFESIASDDVISDVINKEALVFEVIRAKLKITKPQIAKETGIPLGSLIV